MILDQARAVADAVLFEGYALYPYRPSSKKNASRWQFGVIAPRAYAEQDGGEAWWLETQCLLEPRPGGRIRGQLRFLRLRRRRVLAPEPVPSVEIDGHLHVAWDEGELCEIDVETELGATVEKPFELSGDIEDEVVSSRDGSVTARVEKRRSPLEGVVRAEWETVKTSRPCLRLRLRVENRTSWARGGSRDEAMGSSLLGAHVLLHATGAEFMSLIDPPDWASDAAAACKSVHAFPVLAGERERRDVVLAAPIILYDYPQVAPESPGDLFDATEIDEILTLRTRTLTDAEKREACAADPRLAAVIARSDGLSGAALERLHGTLRGVRFEGDTTPTNTGFAPGDHVRLRPGARRADAQDMFLDGMSATIRSILRDVDGRVCLAVTVDDDPAADLHVAKGRFHYFYVDEVERLATTSV